MVNLKKIFGRRMAFVALAIVGLLVAAVACFTVANAAEEGSEDGLFAPGKSYLTSLVAGPKNATFDSSFKYTFTFNGSSATTDPSDADISTSTTDYSSKSVDLDMKVTNGTIETPIVGTNTYLAKGNSKTSGIGTIGSTTEEDGHALTDSDFDSKATVYGYVNQIALNDSSLFPFDTVSDLTTIFPKAGVYNWKVVSSMTKPASTDTDYKYWDESKAEYLFQVIVANDTTGLKISGYIFKQKVTDFGKTIKPFKKSPQKWAGRSFHPYFKPLWDGTTEGADQLIYEGFTFVHNYLQDPDKDKGPDFQPLTIKKTVTGDMGDRTKPFTFSALDFGSNTWNWAQFMYTKDGAAYPEITEINGVVKDSTDTAIGSVNFAISKTPVTDVFGDTVYYAPATASITSVDGDDTIKKFTLKHGDTLTFDGSTYTYTKAGVSTTVTADLIPAGTYYGITEDGVDKYAPKMDVFTANSTEEATVGPLTAGSSITASYTATPAVSNCIIAKIDSTASVSKNHVEVTNDCKDTRTGFLIDAVPYVIMIGIPLAALAMWIIARKRRENN